MKDIEGTIKQFLEDSGEVRIDDKWYDLSSGLMRQAIEHFPVGTEVKAAVEGYTIKSLVKQDPEFIG